MEPAPLSKQCLFCKKVFKKNPTISLREWNETARYCSRSCAKKGKSAWNKGKVGIFTGENNPNWKGDLLNKICAQCKKQFRSFDKQKFCSVGCFAESRAGKPIPALVGRPAWNKGQKTGIATPASWGEGHVPWNKGMVGYGLGEKNGMWKGDEVGYVALHLWVSRRLGKPKFCDHCDRTDAPKYEWANKSGEYKRDVSDWMRLCVPCHKKYDLARVRSSV